MRVSRVDRGEFNVSFLFAFSSCLIKSFFLEHLEILVLMISFHTEIPQSKSVHLALSRDCQQYGGQ